MGEPAAGTVTGELSLGSGWWLQVPRAYRLDYDEDGDPVLHREVVRLQPQVYAFDASGMSETAAELAHGVIADAVTDADGRLTGLGPIAGLGWRGSACRGPLADATDEHELIASLGAAGTLLNLFCTYLGEQTEDEAQWIVAHVVHRRETEELTTRLAAEGVRLEVPPGGADARSP